MNKAAIKAELRCVASHVETSGVSVGFRVWEFLIHAGYRKRFIDYFADAEHESTFYLFVAEDL